MKKGHRMKETPVVLPDSAGVGAGRVDFDRLERAMDAAGTHEDRYWRENDAKFRAVAQKVQSYEEFEDIVKAAHIKPMTEDITQLQLKRTSWLSSARTQERDRRKGATSIQLPLPDITSDTAFELHWKAKETPQEQYNLLTELGGKRIYHLFKPQLRLFDEMVGVLDQCALLPDDTEVVCKLLKAFCRTKRFELCAQMANPGTLDMVRGLYEKLVECGISEEDIERLRAGYGSALDASS
eukprot:m.136486 g.136486  ORF g.136486 m.136486 type:complete len:239 (-) comp13997_c1_seq4:137-853(-)